MIVGSDRISEDGVELTFAQLQAASGLVAGVVNGVTGITAHAGGGQGSAVALTGEYNNITTCATAADSVKLPTAALGKRVVVKNTGAASLAVFPNTSGTINGLAANLSIDVPVGAEVVFWGTSVTAWQTLTKYTLPAPSTQKGSLSMKAANSAGNTETVITNASQAAARTFTIPDPGASGNFLMSTVQQPFAMGLVTTSAGTATLDVTVDLMDGASATLARAVSGMLYVSSDASGLVPVAATITDGASGHVLQAGTGPAIATTTTAGRLAVHVAVAAGTRYLVFVGMDGKPIVSSALTAN